MLSSKAAAFRVDALLGNFSTSCLRDLREPEGKQEKQQGQENVLNNLQYIVNRKGEENWSMDETKRLPSTFPNSDAIIEFGSSKRPLQDDFFTHNHSTKKLKVFKESQRECPIYESDRLTKTNTDNSETSKSSIIMTNKCPENFIADSSKMSNRVWEPSNITFDTAVSRSKINRELFISSNLDGPFPVRDAEQSMSNVIKSKFKVTSEVQETNTQRCHEYLVKEGKHNQNNVKWMPPNPILPADMHFPTVISPFNLTFIEGLEPRWHPPSSCVTPWPNTLPLPGSGYPGGKEGNRWCLPFTDEKMGDIVLDRNRILVQNNLMVELQHQDLWAKFHQHQMEMIITKNGRRMFPVIKVRVYGLNPDDFYIMYLDMEPMDARRYRYAYPSSTWVVAGTGDCNEGDEQVYIHPDSPATGRQWMEMLTISFDKLKLTNHKNWQANKGQIFLHSMQKYKPRLWIQRLEGNSVERGRKSDLHQRSLHRSVDRNQSTQFYFPETSFITVTAYQNQRITRLKINSNPFAKGFRDNSKYNREVIERHTMTPSPFVPHDPYFQDFTPLHFPHYLPFYYPPHPSFPLPPAQPFPTSHHIRSVVTPRRWPLRVFDPLRLTRPQRDEFPSLLPSAESPPETNPPEVVDLRYRKDNT